MNDFIQVFLLGLIEGITEFLPISSTGHLLIAEHWLGARSDVFNVVIQLGAILAVLLIYWQRLLTMVLNFSQPENRDYLLKLFTAFFITAVGGLIAKKLGLKLPVTLQPVAWALLIGGFVILAVEWRAKNWSESTRVTWAVAVAVGLAQIVAAVFPGTSRSAATIFSAMLVGLTSRSAATEFAFIVGIPTMFAASGFELFKLMKDPATAAHEPMFDLALGFVVSAVVAFIAVKWLLGYIQTHRFTVFAWYRIVLGAGLLVIAQ